MAGSATELEAPPETAAAEEAESAPASPETEPAVEIPTLTLYSPWAPDPLRSRLAAYGYELVDDDEAKSTAAAVVVATRYAPPEAVSQICAMETTDIPVIVLTHPAGEATAAALMACGGTAIVAEGNEEAIRLHVEDGSPEEDVLETYAQRLERLGNGDAAPVVFDRDPASNLPGPAALAERLAALSQAGTVPRYGAVKVLGSPTGRLGREATKLLKRRLGSQMQQACRIRGADIFSVGDNEFAVLAEILAADEFASLGHEMSSIASTFAPDRSAPLVLAMGHAGPETGSDVATVRELAERGLAACVDGSLGERIVGADSLTRVFSATTELEALLQAVDVVEQDDPSGPGHGLRVERIVADLAQRLGLEGRRLAAVRLAARLHDLGKIHVPADERFPEGDDGSEAYRSHPRLGADIVRIPAGNVVADTIAGHHEHWDGTGFPDGTEGTDIPFEARILAVADALDRWSSAPDPTPEALTRIKDEAGSRFDPTVVAVLEDL